MMTVLSLFAVLCAGASQLLPGDPGRELWSSPWTDVTPRNGVWDDYYRRTDDRANCSFRFRVMRHAAAIGVEAFVRDDKVVVDDCPANSISCETWKDDCLEVFFDGDDDRNPNTRGPAYETNPTPCNAGGEYAIAANGSSQSDYASAKKCFGTLWGGRAEPWEENGRRVGTHYRLWFGYECLKRPTPRPDEPVSFGFTICVHDDDDGGANDLALYWKGNPKIPYADESAFGRVSFPPAAVVATNVGTGWQNVCDARREVEPVKVLWTAPSAGFRVEKEGGAEGEVEFADGAVKIRKTNGKGQIVVTAPSFAAEKGKRLRFFADVSVRTDSPWSAGYLCAWSSKRELKREDAIAAPWFFAGGYPMICMVNSAPGMTYRKYRHLDPDSETATLAIVVTGSPSESTWRNLAAEDFAAADAAWDDRYRHRNDKLDYSADMQPRDEFLRTLAADRDHTAAVEIRDGYSRLVIDGEVSPPIAYKISTLIKPGAVTYAGKKLQDRAGVNLGVMNLRLADVRNPDKGFWTEKGFDAKRAADFLEGPMRVGDRTLFILAIGTSAYPAFTEKEHPEDVWRHESGRVAYGNSGSIIPDRYNDGGAKDPGDRRWPWVSMAAPSWRAAIKKCTAELFAELRRRGMLKRIVGVHYYGYHDGQLSMPILDYSPHVKAAYAEYLRAKGLKGTEPAGTYAYFCRQMGFLALEDFSREAKRLAGKPILAVKWNDSPFHQSFDVTSFVNSDTVDIIVPQVDYHHRLPGLPQGLNATTASYHRHGKLLWMEFDLRTYNALDVWARSVIWSKGLNTAEDLPMWQTLLRKNAGMINASRMGWWMYDMAAGWYYDDEIADDFRKVRDVRREMESAKPDPWRPDVALVVDEQAIANYNTPHGPKVPAPVTLTSVQWWRNNFSGVPHEGYLASDVCEHPEILNDYKAVLLVGYVSPSDAQKEFMKSLEQRGIKALVFRPWCMSPKEINEFATKAGAFVAARSDVLEVDMNGDFLSLHCIVPGRHRVKLPFKAKVVNLKDGATAVADELELELTAGETRWYRLFRVPARIVRLEAGVRELTQPMAVGAADGDVVFEGGGKAVLSGARALPPFVAGGDGIWRTPVPKGAKFSQVFVNGRFAVRAREPNSGRFFMDRQSPVKADLRREAFVCDVPGITTNSYVRLWQQWVQGIHRVSAIDEKTKTVRLAPKSNRNFFGEGERALPYVIENFRAALNAPGEWFHDEAAGMLLYIPREGEDVATTRASVPLVDCLLNLEGCRNVTFRNVRFSGCGLDTSAGMIGTQAQPLAGAAIRLAGATNVVFEGCTFGQLGGTAIRVGNDCRNIAFRDCLVEEFGVGGVYIGGERRLDRVPAGVTVDNCLIRRGGRIIAGGIGVWIGHARDVSVTHNEICDLYYSGVSSGWSWGYRPTPVYGIRINDNYIHDIGQYALSDMAGIYTLGDHHGSEVIGNRVHDVWSNDVSGRGGWGLYADEGSTGIRFESNLVYRTKTGSIHQHYGKNVVWRNNVFAYAQAFPVEHTRVEPHHSFDFVNNIVVWTNETKGLRLARPIPGGPASNVTDVAFAKNVYWRPNGPVGKSFHDMEFDEWQRLGMDAGSVVADPQLEDPASGRWMPKPGSVAYRLGFRAFDPMAAGLRQGSKAAWANADRTPIPPAVKPPLPPWWGEHRGFFFDFDGYPSEKLPPQIFASFTPGPSKKGALRLTSAQSLSGSHSLEFRDAADVKRAFQPHILCTFDLAGKAVRFGFAMMVDGGEQMTFLLRDCEQKGRAFVNGPAIAFRKGRIFAGGREIATVKPGKWFRVEMEVSWKGKVEYSVSVDRLDGAKPIVARGLAIGNNGFARPTWCGFTSDAVTDTVTYVDDFFMKPLR